MSERRPSAPDRFIRTTAQLDRPKGCRNKIRYPKRKQALGALNALLAADPADPDNDRLMAYKCQHGCHGWHIGHDKKRAA